MFRKACLFAITCWLLTLTGQVFAQNTDTIPHDSLPVEYRLHYSNSLFNNIVENPAYAGAAQQAVFKMGFGYSMPFRTIYDWMNYPIAADFSYDGYIGKKKNFGIGACLSYTSETFKENKQGLLAINYRLKLGKYSRLRIGLSAMYFSLNYNQDAFHFPDEFNYGHGQGHVYQTSEAMHHFEKRNINFGAGLFYTRKLMWAGFSVANLTEPDVGLMSLSRIPRIYSLSGGNTFRLKKKFSVIPSVNLAFTQNKSLIMNSVMASWNNMLGGGVSLRNLDFFYGRVCFNFLNHFVMEGYMEIPLNSTIRNGFGWLTHVGGSLKYSFSGNKNILIIQ